MDDILFPIMGYVALGVGSIDVGAVLKQVTAISNVFARGATLFGLVSDDDMWGAVSGW